MEALTRLVTDSLARHGFDRPVDPRRLLWSRWSRCDSPHSLLVVPSKPGIFALAEEIMDFGPTQAHVEDGPLSRRELASHAVGSSPEGTAFMSPGRESGVSAHEGTESRRDGTHSDAISKRMLAVLQFSEDDDMAFTLDRMFTRINPMRARLASGRCFVRFVVIEDQAQRRSICNALNQWMLTSAEKASGLPADFQSSLELAADDARVGRTLFSDSASSIPESAQAPQSALKLDVASAAPHLDSGSNKNLHCPHPLPSGF
jgi:hypothetical protein